MGEESDWSDGTFDQRACKDYEIQQDITKKEEPENYKNYLKNKKKIVNKKLKKTLDFIIRLKHHIFFNIMTYYQSMPRIDIKLMAIFVHGKLRNSMNILYLIITCVI